MSTPESASSTAEATATAEATDAVIAEHTSENRYREAIEFDSVGLGSHCVDCYPGGCPYHVYVKDGKIIREEIAPIIPQVETGAPDTLPMGCNKGAAWSEQLTSPDRLKYPLRRVGERGSGEWERITWSEALTEVADAILDAHESEGAESVIREGTPEVATVFPTDRFMGLIGGVVTDLNGSINDFAPGHHLVFGKFYPIGGDMFHSDTILIWHLNPVYTIIPFFHFFAEARYNGTDIVLIAPDVSPSHTHADYHVPLEWGSDPAFALSMCQVIVEEGLVDEEFVRVQTDLSLLVRTDNDRYLRQSDIVEGGSDEVFYHCVDGRGPVEAARDNLLLDYEPILSGTCKVTLADGSEAEVRPLMDAMREVLADYTPEKAQAITNVHPEMVRTIARKVASGRTRIVMGMGANKAYHSDLYQRTMNLLLALTGNWGRLGSGTNCWAASQMDGQAITGAKQLPGPEGAELVMAGMDMAEAAIKASDPSLSDELVAIEFWRQIGRNGFTMVPPAFFWYWHCGFKERWNNAEWSDPDMKRSFDDYFNEAIDSGWWDGVMRPGPEVTPKVLIECGGNILRRTRGGRGMLLENLWPKLEKIVTIDIRMSATALHSDIVLPAAQHYEKVNFHIPIVALILSDKVAEPLGESMPEWEIFAALCEKIAERAEARGVVSFMHRDGTPHKYADLWKQYTLDGYLDSSEKVADEIIRDCAYAGTLPDGSDLAKVREEGYVRFVDWGRMAMAKGQATPFPSDGPMTAFRNHVEIGDPYPTLTRRAQFLIEHPWFVEAGEELPVHKDSPKMGGDYPFRMTTGHNRWSIHAMNMANRHLLNTHRGEPFAFVHTGDAERLGFADGDRLRVSNDAGSFVVRARVTGAQKPFGITVYNGWDPFMFEGWNGPNEVEPGMVKWLGLAGGYGHLQYAPMEWQPVPIDRFVHVNVEKA